MDKLFCKSTNDDTGRSTTNRKGDLNLEYASISLRTQPSPVHEMHVINRLPGRLAGPSLLGMMLYWKVSVDLCLQRGPLAVTVADSAQVRGSLCC